MSRDRRGNGVQVVAGSNPACATKIPSSLSGFASSRAPRVFNNTFDRVGGFCAGATFKRTPNGATACEVAPMMHMIWLDMEHT